MKQISLDYFYHFFENINILTFHRTNQYQDFNKQKS